jgi:transposase
VKQVGLDGYLKEEDGKEYLLDAEHKAQRLNRTARDAWRLKEWLKAEKKKGAWEGEKMEKTLRLLEKTLEDYVEEESQEDPPPEKKRGRNRKGSVKKKKRGRKRFKKRKKKGTGRLISFKDEDARWGAKSDKKTFAGYKAHTMENENQLVLDTEVTPGNISDDAPVIGQVERVKEKHGIEIEKLIGDTKYGTGDIREKMQHKGAQVVAPLMPATNKKGYYTNDKFEYDEAADHVTCPAGRRSERKARNSEGNSYVHFFPAPVCNKCSKKSKCTESDNGRAVSVSDYRELFAEAAEYNTTDAYKEDMKIRAHIEPKQWEMKHMHGLVRVRYRGLDKVQQQAHNVATVVNLKRWVKLHKSNQQSPSAPENGKCAKVANS